MQIIPNVVPISQLQDNHKEIFSQIEILEARLKYLESKRQFQENPPTMISFDDIEEKVKAER